MRTRRPLRTVLSLAIVGAVVCWAGAASAPQAAEPPGAAGSEPTTEPPAGRDVIIGTVKSVSDLEATNANPPRVIFEITETLKGDLKGTIRVGWREAPADYDDVDPAKTPYGTAWADQKVEKPKVGDSYILFGRITRPIGILAGNDGREPLWFYTSPGGRMALTAENRDKALQAIQFYVDKAKADAERRAAEAARAAARHAEAVQRFRTSMTDEKLTAAVQSADFVALARFGGVDSDICSFQVTEVLKGRNRLSPPPKDTGPSDHDYSNRLAFEVPRDVAAALSPGPGQTGQDRKAAALEAPPLYVMMLSEKGLSATFYDLRYQPVGNGVAFADDATVKRVRELTQGQAGKGAPAVLVDCHCSKFLDALDAAAGGKVAFVRICLGPGLDALDKATVSRGLDVDWLLNIEGRSASGNDSKPSYKLQLARRGEPKTVLMDMTLTGPDEKAFAAHAPDIIAAILKDK